MNGNPTSFSLIPLSSVVVPDDYILTLHKKNLCEVIRLTGLMMPIVVRRQNDKYILVDGYDRLRCARELGWREVPAIIVDDERTDILRLALNYVRGKVCGIDVLLYVWQLSQQYDVSVLARILGREYETIRKYRSAAEHLINILAKDDFEELHNQCISVRRILRCVPEAHSREEFYSCLAYKPTGKRVTPEAVKKAIELEKSPELREAIDLVQLVGREKVEKLIQVWDIIKKTMCTRLSDYKACLLPEDYRALELLCQ